MTTYISEKLVTATSTIREDMNQVISGFNGPVLGTSNDVYERSKQFVAFNEWLRGASPRAIRKLARGYGLLPVVYSLTGIEVMDVMLLQEKAKLDLLGHVRYLSLWLFDTTENDAVSIADLTNVIFGDVYGHVDDTPEARSKFVSYVIEYFINTSSVITYEQSMVRFLALMTADDEA